MIKSLMDFKVPILMGILCFVVTSFSYAQSNENISLNGKWSFKTDPYAQGESSQWFAKDVNTTSWGTMAVPGNWDLVTNILNMLEMRGTLELLLLKKYKAQSNYVWCFNLCTTIPKFG